MTLEVPVERVGPSSDTRVGKHPRKSVGRKILDVSLPFIMVGAGIGAGEVITHRQAPDAASTQGHTQQVSADFLKQMRAHSSLYGEPVNVDLGKYGSASIPASTFGNVGSLRHAQQVYIDSGSARTERPATMPTAETANALGTLFLGLPWLDRKKAYLGLTALAVIMSACAPIIAPTPTLRPSEVAPVVVPSETPFPRLTADFLNTSLDSPLVPWDVFTTPDGIWIHESSPLYKNVDGSLAIFHPTGDPNTSVAFGTRKYLIGQGSGNGVITGTERAFLMMYTQVGTDKPTAEMLVGSAPLPGQSTTVDTYALSSGVLAKDTTTQVKITLNADGTYLFTRILNGKASPLVLETAANQQLQTPVAVAKDVFDVSYLTQKPAEFTFGAAAVVTPQAPTPETAITFSLDTVTGLDPTLKAALRAHAGLEASITPEANGQFTANVTVLTTEGQPTTAPMTVTPETMTQDLTSKNKYGDTPVMILADGSKIYWIQEERAWFEVNISPDINTPVFVPYAQREVALRVVITEFNQPFSPEAIARWNAKTAQYGIGIETHQVNAITHEWTKWAYLINRSISDPGLTTTNSPIQTLNTWFTTTIPDGTSFEYYFTKWLDPADPRNPQPDEWKVMQNAIGTEISSIKQNRDQFAGFLFNVKNNAPVWFSIPIVKVDPNFFSNPNLPNILPILQPSLNKLLGIPGNDFLQLKDPRLAQYNLTYDFDINGNSSVKGGWDLVTQTSPSFIVNLETNNPDFKSEFFSSNVQMLFFPTFLMQR